jgi:hypothetical protein
MKPLAFLFALVSILIAEPADLKKLEATLPITHYSVWMNTEEGLIVERMVERKEVIPTRGARVGAGGKAVTITNLEPSGKYFFIRHIPSTRNMANDKRFKAKVQPLGQTHRTDPSTVYEVLRIIRLNP